MSASVPNLDNTLGVLFFCTMFAMGLWGAACIQVYYYYKKYTRDSWGLQLLVAGVITGDTIHQGMIIHTSYEYQISSFGDVNFIMHIVSTVIQMVLANALVTTAVQVFFVRRAWYLSKKCRLLVAVLILLVFSEFLCTIVFYGKAISIKTFPELEKIYGLTRSMNALSAVTSTVLSASLIFLLNRSRTGFEETETIIDRLIAFMLGTGLLTTMVSIGCLITITVLPTSRIYIGLYYLCSKLYTNSLLASLNARRDVSSVSDHESDSPDASGSEASQPRVVKMTSIHGKKSINVQLVSIDLSA